MTQRRNLAVLDLETDPFKFGRVPRPFASGFYDGKTFSTIWDDERCIDRTVEFLAAKSDPLIIYAHNGGKFDWLYFLKYLVNGSSMRIINNRIAKAYLGIHEIRDSFSIMPFALKAYNKKDIDIAKMQSDIRKHHREEILEYLKIDCVSLYELVTAFWDEFGDVLTVGSAGLHELKRFHKFDTGGPAFDERIRGQYYYGGRVQVFTPGIVTGPIKMIDTNSMYPYVMANYLHPIGVNIEVAKRIQRNTCFVTAEGISHGAFAVRNKLGGIDFPWGSGTYHTTIHEWLAAEQTGTFNCKRILKTYGFADRTTFDVFVHHFYNAKVSAKISGDKIHELFYKYVLNSTYGKFGQNPDNFYEYAITKLGEVMQPHCVCENECTCANWQISASATSYMIWKKPLTVKRYYNIATAASITGAARAVLLLGMCEADTVHYCDTDSIFARGSGSLTLSDTELGAWKLEATAARGAFAGKKLYALFDAEGTCIKKAHKGIPSARPGLQGLTGDDIVRVAMGETIKVANDIPHFKLSGAHGFVSRTVRRTV